MSWAPQESGPREGFGSKSGLELNEEAERGAREPGQRGVDGAGRCQGAETGCRGAAQTPAPPPSPSGPCHEPETREPGGWRAPGSIRDSEQADQGQDGPGGQPQASPAPTLCAPEQNRERQAGRHAGKQMLKSEPLPPPSSTTEDKEEGGSSPPTQSHGRKIRSTALLVLAEWIEHRPAD